MRGKDPNRGVQEVQVTKRKALGKGLGALIQGIERGEGNYIHLPIEDIGPSRFQPRRRFDDEKIRELADSIKENGIIEPLLVRRRGGDYELIAGERRLRAARLAGLKDVPVLVMDLSDEGAQEVALVENIQREELNPLEEAEAFKALMDGFGLSQEEIARKVGKDRATVANFLRVLKLPPDIKEELVKGSITMGHAKAILSLEGNALQREVAKRVVKKGLSVRETERLIERYKKDKKTTRGKASRVGPLEDELRRIFGTKVSIKEKNGKGRIEIEFYSLEELDRLLEVMRVLKV